MNFTDIKTSWNSGYFNVEAPLLFSLKVYIIEVCDVIYDLFCDVFMICLDVFMICL